MVDALVPLVLGGVVIPFVWALWCVSQAGSERLRIINAWPLHPHEHARFAAVRLEFYQTSFEAHAWRLMTFRDPRYLYGDKTWDMMSWKR